MKRRIQKVKKFELLISTSTYELQLYNGYIFIFYFKIWQWYIAFLSKIYYISVMLYVNKFLSAIYIMGPLGSLRALNVILVEISIVCISLTHHFG